LHWAGARQLEEDAVLVLFDLRGDLAEGHDDRRGLGLRERGMVYSGGPSGLVEDLRSPREQQPEGLGQEGGGRGAGAA
jgi:hypothetical protein